jgi:hypothetical protein
MGGQLSALDLWVIKEACFKSNPRNEGGWLSQYQVIAYDAATETGQVEWRPDGERVGTAQFRVVRDTPWIVAFAKWDGRQL